MRGRLQEAALRETLQQLQLLSAKTWSGGSTLGATVRGPLATLPAHTRARVPTDARRAVSTAFIVRERVVVLSQSTELVVRSGS